MAVAVQDARPVRELGVIGVREDGPNTAADVVAEVEQEAPEGPEPVVADGLGPDGA